jgi:hypothetical protein
LAGLAAQPTKNSKTTPCKVRCLAVFRYNSTFMAFDAELPD